MPRMELFLAVFSAQDWEKNIIPAAVLAADYGVVFFLGEVLGAVFKPLPLQVINKGPQMVF